MPCDTAFHPPGQGSARGNCSAGSSPAASREGGQDRTARLWQLAPRGAAAQSRRPPVPAKTKHNRTRGGSPCGASPFPLSSCLKYPVGLAPRSGDRRHDGGERNPSGAAAGRNIGQISIASSGVAGRPHEACPSAIGQGAQPPRPGHRLARGQAEGFELPPIPATQGISARLRSVGKRHCPLLSASPPSPPPWRGSRARPSRPDRCPSGSCPPRPANPRSARNGG